MLKKIIGVLLVLGALYLGWTSITPYLQNYQFWSLFGPAGLMILSTWWIVMYGWQLLIAVIVLIVGIILFRKSG